MTDVTAPAKPAELALETIVLHDQQATQQRTGPVTSGTKSKTGMVIPASRIDRGFAWIVCLAGFLGNTLAVGQIYIFAAYYNEMMAAFGTSLTTTSWVGSIALAMVPGFGVLAGKCIHTYGTRTATTIGSVSFLVGLVVSSFVDKLWYLFVTYGLMVGLGGSTCYLSSIVAVGHYFSKRKAFATGLAVSGSGAGTLLLAPVVHVLIAQYGWRNSLRIQAAMFVGVMPFVIWAFPGVVQQSESPASTPSTSTSLSPTSSPSPPSAGTPAQSQSEATIDESARSPRASKSSVQPFISNGLPRSYASLVCDPNLRLLLASIALLIGAYFIPFVFIVKFATESLLIDSGAAAWTISAIGAGSTVSRALIGYIGDYVASYRVLFFVLMTVSNGVMVLLFPAATDLPSLLTICCLFGLSGGAAIALLPVLTGDYIAKQDLPKAIGLVMSAQFPFVIVGPPVATLIINACDGKFFGAFVFAGACILASNVFLLPIARKRRRVAAINQIARAESQVEL